MASEARGKVQHEVLLRITLDPGITTAGLTTGKGALGRSSVYGAIDALQAKGLIEARWDMDDRPPCRRFSAIQEFPEAD